MKNTFLKLSIFIGIVAFAFYSCNKDEDPIIEDPVASFQFEIDATDFLQANFTNYSQNASAYVWDFGDGSTSTEENPTHTFASAGDYIVKLTAANSAGSTHEYSQTITITDPQEAYKLLTGEVSKSWRLMRESVAMGIGPDAAGYTSYWSLENDGKRPCVYKQTWTFNFDGTFTFDDGGEMWGENNVFEGTDLYETCFPAESANMVNKDNVDVSAWLGGSHSFEYDPTLGKLTLTGDGAWIGLVKVTAAGDVSVPQQTVSYDVTITEEASYDLMVISVTGEDWFWQFNYVSYDNPADEPNIVEEQKPWGEDLPDITPTEMFITFASRDASEMATIDTIASGSNIIFGVTDPAGGGTNVGQYNRTTETYQEQKFMANPKSDITFTNFTQVSFDVYLPSTNDYAGTLTQNVLFGIAESSETEQWWNHHIQYDSNNVALDIWTNITFDLDSPTSGAGLGTYLPADRTDLDMFFINIGGSGHADPGIFYIRNLEFK